MVDVSAECLTEFIRGQSEIGNRKVIPSKMMAVASWRWGRAFIFISLLKWRHKSTLRSTGDSRNTLCTATYSTWKYDGTQKTFLNFFHGKTRRSNLKTTQISSWRTHWFEGRLFTRLNNIIIWLRMWDVSVGNACKRQKLFQTWWIRWSEQFSQERRLFLDTSWNMILTLRSSMLFTRFMWSFQRIIMTTLTVRITSERTTAFCCLFQHWWRRVFSTNYSSRRTKNVFQRKSLSKHCWD